MIGTALIRNREMAHYAAHILREMTGDKVKVFSQGRNYRLMRWTGSEWVRG